MNADHPDDLVLIARRFAGEAATEAETQDWKMAYGENTHQTAGDWSNPVGSSRHAARL